MSIRFWAGLLALAGAFAAAPLEAQTGSMRRVSNGMSGPLAYEPNVGQADDDVRWVARAAGYTLLLTDTEARMVVRRSSGRDTSLVPGWLQRKLQAPRSAETTVVRQQLVGANTSARWEALERQTGVSHYLFGPDPAAWRRDVPHHARLRQQGVYEGVDLVWHGQGNRAEYDFVVAPGANPDQVELAWEGLSSVSTDAATGDLLLWLDGQTALRQRRPDVYQEANGVRTPVQGRYKLGVAGRVGFEVGAYDRSKPLVIDPTIEFANFHGGSGDDVASSLAVDRSGNLLVAGTTDAATFRDVNGQDIDGGRLSDLRTGGGRVDAFLLRLAPDGNTTLSVTFFGGSGDDEALDLALTAQGGAVLTGETSSPNFPVVNARQSALRGASDAFLTRLSADGRSLELSTYYGGSAEDAAASVAVDGQGQVIIAGATRSTDLPVTAARQANSAGGLDAFVARFSADGRTQSFGTYLGGSGDEVAASVAVDSQGSAYVVGATQSADFPVQAARQPALSGTTDAFLAKFSPDGQTFVFSTFLGGSGRDHAFDVAVDTRGSAHVVGMTDSTNFPMASARQSAPGGMRDTFVSRFTADGRSLVYSTYLGGSGEDAALAVALDAPGNAHVVGLTNSRNFPTVEAPLDIVDGGEDIVAAKLSPDGRLLSYSFAQGSPDNDGGFAVATGAQDVVFIAGVLGGLDRAVYVAKLQDRVLRPQTRLEAAPVQLSFAAQLAGANTSAQTVRLSSGAAVLNYSARATVPWLVVSTATANGTTPGALTVVATPSAGGLTAAGSYTGSIVVTAPSAANGPLEIPVTLVLTDNRPTLSATPATVALTATAGGPVSAAVPLSIASSGVAAAFTVSGNQPWLRISPASGTAPGTLQVSADPAGLGPGQNTAMLTITSSTARNTTLQVPVTFTVMAGQRPSLTLSSGTLSFAGQTGTTAAAPQAVMVSSSGAALDFTVQSTSSWLRVTPNTGRTPATLSVVVDPSGLAADTYRGQLIVSAAEAGNGVQRVEVTYQLTEPPRPRLSVLGGNLTFAAQEGGGATPAQSAVVESSGAPLAFAVTKDTPSPWLQVEPASGTTRQSISLTANPAGLAPGTYTAVYRVASDGASNGPVVQTAVLTVSAAPLPDLTLSAVNVSFTGPAGGASPAAQNVALSSGDRQGRFAVSQDQPWLRVNPAAGSTPATLSVAVDQTGLPPGVHRGGVVVTGNFRNSPQRVEVEVTVTEPPPPPPMTPLTVEPAAGLSFSHQAGARPPAEQTLGVGAAGEVVSFTVEGRVRSPEGGRWLEVITPSGVTNASVRIAVNPAGLPEGRYDGVVVITAAGRSQVEVPVTLQVVQPSPVTLETDRRELTFFSASGAAPERVQLTVLNPALDRVAYNAVPSTEAGGPWLSVSPSGGGTGAESPGTLVVVANPSGLAPGTYTGKVDVQGSGDVRTTPLSVPVVLTVGRAQRALLVADTSLTVRARANRSPDPQSIELLMTGQGTANYRIVTESLKGGNWFTVEPSGGQITAGRPAALTIRFTSDRLSPDDYEGVIRLESTDADNSPQMLRMTLQVSAQGGSPSTVPTGLAFTATAGGPNPAARPVLILKPDARPSAAYSYTALPDPTPVNWMRRIQGNGSFDARTGAGSITVQPDIAGLAPGTYRGIIAINVGDGIARNVSVLLVVQPAAAGEAGTSKALPGALKMGCQPTEFLPLLTSLETDFTVRTGQSAATEVVVVDNCGSFVTNGSVGGTFTSRDRPLDLVPLGDGRWKATWVPRRDDLTREVAIRLRATDANPSGEPGEAPLLYGRLLGNTDSPILDAQRPLVSPAGEPMRAVAPGSRVVIRGLRLAERPEQAAGSDAVTELAGTRVTLGGRPLRLIRVSREEVEAVVPADAPTLARLPLVVQRGDRLSAPELVLVAESWPMAASPAESITPGQVGLLVTGLGARGQLSVRGEDGSAAVDSVEAIDGQEGLWWVRLRLPRGSRGVALGTSTSRTQQVQVR